MLQFSFAGDEEKQDKKKKKKKERSRKRLQQRPLGQLEQTRRADWLKNFCDGTEGAEPGTRPNQAPPSWH